METETVYRGFTRETVERTAAMLERFFAYVAALGEPGGVADVSVMSLPAALAEFKRRFQRQPATYMLFADIPVAADPSGPWPEVLVYCDEACQLFFDRDNPLPVAARNYLAAGDTEAVEFAAEEALPEVSIEQSAGAQDSKTITISARSHKPARYAVALWGDYARADVQAPARVRTHLLGREALLVSFDLDDSPLRFELRFAPAARL